MKNKFIMTLKFFIILTIVSITLGREILISDNIHKGKAMEIKSTSIGDSGTEEVSTRLEGAGTEESPYLIKSAADMRYMRNVINDGISEGSPGVINGTEAKTEAISAYYKLVNSIDLGKNWKAICLWKNFTEVKGNDMFSGHLDGNHKKIRFSSEEEGLFGIIGRDATIEDLTVNATIANDNSERNDISVFYIGIIAGGIYGTECKILGCRIEGSIQINGCKYSETNIPQFGFSVGGVVGLNNGLIKDTECLVSINCSKIFNARGGVGGIIGYNYQRGQLINCNYEHKEEEEMNLNDVYLNDVYCNSGGVIGRNEGKVSNIVCTANVEMKNEEMNNDGSFDQYFGGGMGFNSDRGEVYNTVLKVQIKSISTCQINGGYVGGIIAENYGKLYNSYVKGEISSDMYCNENMCVYLGGLVGRNNDGGRKGEIDNCFSMLKLTIIDNSKLKPDQLKKGSIIGESNANVVNCFGINYNDDGSASSLCGINFKKDDNLPLDKNRLEKILNERTKALNTSSGEIKYNSWKLDNSINEGYPFLIQNSIKAPYYVETDNTTISVYGNGYPIIVAKDKNENTVIYFDKDGDNKIGSEDSLVKTLDENEGEGARFGSGYSINIYGGGYNSDISRKSSICVIGGNINYIYGGGHNGISRKSSICVKGGNINSIYGGGHNSDISSKSSICVMGGNINYIYGGGKSDENNISAKVLSGTVIDIKGGKIGCIDANGKADKEENSGNVVTEGYRTIKLSGAPVIGSETMDGINLDSFTKKNITDTLTGSKGSICAKTNNLEHGNVIATATNAIYTENYNVFKVKNLPDNKTIFNKDKDIIIVDTFKASLNPSDGTESNSNVEKISGFGDNAAKKDFKWTGKISAKPGYILPNELMVKMGGTELTVGNGNGYTWNKQSGEVKIDNVTGDIEVTAKAIYVPPIIAVDKPFVSTTAFSYTGTPQSPILIDTDKYSVSATRETNVGEYTMVVSLKDKVYTRWNDGTNDDLYIKWRINKVDMKVIANDKSITYGDSPTNAGVSYEGFVNGEDESVLKGTLSYDYDYNLYDNVGNYTITPKGYEANNYNITYTLGTLKVLPKKLSFKWSSLSEFKYDGKVKVMTASIVGIVNNDDVRIASYAHNKTDKVGTYVAKVTGITGTKKDNYTLEGATNISKKWSIVKNEDKEDKDKNENKDNIKDNGDKNDTSGSNNNKGNVNNNKNNNKNNNSSNNTSSNKGNNNNNQSNGNYDKVNMYDKLANNNDYKTDIEGATEGVKTSDNEIQVELNNGMIISAMGDFEESIRLMVKEIKSKRKEWNWVNSLTKDIGINKGIYDIFFVNSKGVKVNTGRGTKISILSREKLQKADVYYIRTSSERLKLKSWKEEYTVKFRMIENGYYTLILNDKNNLIEGKGDGVNVVDKDSTTDNNDKNSNKNADTINDKDNQGGIEEDKTNENASKDGASGSEINTSQDSTNHNVQNTDKQQNDKEGGINWVIIISIISSIIVMIIVSGFILKRFSKDK